MSAAQLLLILNWLTLAFTSEWFSYDDQDCPNCILFSADTNFTAILSFESKVLLGARNSLYEINFSEETYRLYEDKSDPRDYETCVQEGRRPVDCQNYYKVILRVNEADLFICGTNAFSPVCGVRALSDLSYSTHSKDGVGICPADPHSSTSYLRLKESQYGFAGAEKASSSEYAISLINLRYDSYKIEASTKTTFEWLKKPQFIYSFENGDYVYFIFKEIAVEVTNMERIYSRIARICKKDYGGAGPFFLNTFLTYVKARIYCSYTKPGQSPFDFNEMGGAYYLDGILYAHFSGPSSVIDTGSILCRFPMEDIHKVFEGRAKFYNQGNWVDEREPSPFTCEESRSIDQARRHQLMASSVVSHDPLYYSSLQMNGLWVSNEKIENETSVVANAGTTSGALIRVACRAGGGGAVRSRIFKIEGRRAPVTAVSVPDGTSALRTAYMMADTWVASVPLLMPCNHHQTCQTCQQGFPYCGWCQKGEGAGFSCTTAAQCASSAGQARWMSPYDNCPALVTFKTRPGDQTVHLTDQNPVESVTLICEADSRGIRPSWSRLSGQIPSSAIQSDDGRSLVIHVERYTDAGEYICSLQNEAGIIQASAEITVLVAPTFVKTSPSNISVAIGDDVVMVCEADGNPRPTVTWHDRSGETLPNGAKIDETTGELKLIRALAADEGRYFCRIDNGIGPAKTSHDIVVTVTARTPANEPTTDMGEPFNYKVIMLVVAGAILAILIVVVATHCFLRRRRSRNKRDPGYQVYHEQVLATNLGHHPDYLEEQNPMFRYGYVRKLVTPIREVHCEWGQLQPGPSSVAYLMPGRSLEEEPPPAYHADIELHAVRGVPSPQEHFFLPVQVSPDRGSGRTGPASSDTITPPIRGPTPPPRSTVGSRNTQPVLAPPPHGPAATVQQAGTTSPPHLSDHISEDSESVHEYERIGLLACTTPGPPPPLPPTDLIVPSPGSPT